MAKSLPVNSVFSSLKISSKSNLTNEEMQAHLREARDRIKEIRWATRDIAEDISREDYLVITFKNAVTYFIFIIFITIAIVGPQSFTYFYMTDAIKKQFCNRRFTTSTGLEIDFHRISSVSDFWNFVENLLIDNFYWDFYYDRFHPIAPVIEDDRKILFENELLGVPRLRQVRVRNDSCRVHEYFRRFFVACYDTFDSDSEETIPFGLGTTTAWVYSGEDDTGSISYNGKVAGYNGAGYYIDFYKDLNQTLELIKNLKENLWITRGTRAVFVDFSMYNANLNIFCVCKMIFEFPPTGGVLPSTQFRSIRLVSLPIFTDYFIFICSVISYIFIFYYLILNVRNIMFFGFRYFTKFWTYVDIIIFMLSFFTLIYDIILYNKIWNDLERIINHPNKYGNLESSSEIKIILDNMEAVKLFLIYIKIFDYLNFNKTMGQLNNTLKKCALDVLGFSIMFFIIFCAYAELGYLIFGTQLEDFCTFMTSMYTLLRTILGDFDYRAIEEANRVLAPVYFFSYIFFVFFVLLNMFLAIINDTYTDVKTEIAIAPDEIQMTQFLKKGLFDILKRCGFKIKADSEIRSDFNITVMQIRDAFRRCGFTDLEIEMFFARYNIDPRNENAEYDVNELLKLLDSGTDDHKRTLDADFVKLNDFQMQEQKLDQIMESIDELIVKVEGLLKKMEGLDYVKKTKT